MSGVKITVPIKVKADYDPYRDVEVNGCLFRCYESGKVERQLNDSGSAGKAGEWKRCDTNKPKSVRNRPFIQLRAGYRKMVLLHRIIYLAYNPTFDITDTNRMVDHINGDSLDNRPINLREATRSENGCNQKASSNTGIKNIYDLNGNWWHVVIMKDGKRVIGKTFDKRDYTLDDVKLYRNDELLKHHGEFARLD